MDKNVDIEYSYSCIQVGQQAPSFAGEAYANNEITSISLEDYKGKWILLFFYPLDFTFVCPTEIKGYSEQSEAFTKRNVQIIGCSIDSVYAHKAWIEGSLGMINFPLLSDITKNIARKYGVLIEEKGIALRGTFIIDTEGILRYMLVHDLNVGRSVDETLRVIDALQSGGLCPMDWHQGQATLND